MTEESAAVAVVRRFTDAWHHLDADGIGACFADDSEWLNVSYDPVNGRGTITELCRKFLDAVAEGDLHLHYIGEVAPGVVLTERTDIFHMKSGYELTIPAMGAFTVKDGLIVSWRDYFDPAVMNF